MINEVLQWIFIIVTFIMSLISLIIISQMFFPLLGMNKSEFPTLEDIQNSEGDIETFDDFPLMGDAQKTGFYKTFNRKCKPGLNKCVVKNNSGSYHYFCSKDCHLKKENVKGEKIEEPMSWEVRYA